MPSYSSIINDFYKPSILNVIPFMDFVRELTSDVSSIRKFNNIPEAYPLISLDIYVGDDLFPLVNSMWFKGSSEKFDTPYRDLIKESCNVDEVFLDYSTESSRKMHGISETIVLDFRKAGPVFGKDMGRISKAMKSGNYSKVDGGIDADGIIVPHGYYTSRPETPDLTTGVKTLDKDTFISLDLRLGFGKSKYASSILKKEINSVRKSIGAGTSDYVDVVVHDSEENINYYKRHEDYIKDEANASSIDYRISSLARSVSVGRP